jgi:hypothetical protein
VERDFTARGSGKLSTDAAISSAHSSHAPQQAALIANFIETHHTPEGLLMHLVETYLPR